MVDKEGGKVVIDPDWITKGTDAKGRPDGSPAPSKVIRVRGSSQSDPGKSGTEEVADTA